jgi:hypothetical protein
MRRRRTFILGLAAVFAVACALQVVAHTTVLWGPDNQEAHQLAAGFGDAFLIAVVLAILVDPVAQHKFATEWGRDLFWTIFSPKAPQEFKDAVQAIAAPLGYISHCRYELEFKDPKDGADGFFELELADLGRGGDARPARF